MKIVQIGTCVANDDLTQIVKENQPELLVLIEPMSIHNEKINECYSGINNIFSKIVKYENFNNTGKR